MCEQIEKLQKSTITTTSFECVALMITSNTPEILLISCRKELIKNLFPELKIDVNWECNDDYCIRFPLNNYCQLNSIEIINRLLNVSFNLVSSNGIYTENQKSVTEYLFSRKSF